MSKTSTTSDKSKELTPVSEENFTDITDFIEEPLSEETEKAIDDFATTVANDLMEQLKKSLPEGYFDKEKVPADLIAAADNWRKENCPNAPSTHSAFIAGALWQREQDMNKFQKLYKKIFDDGYDEGFASGRDDMGDQIYEEGITFVFDQSLPTSVDSKLRAKNVNYGDKLLIIKKEEE